MEQTKLRQILFPDMHSAQETIRTLWDIDEGYGNTSRAILRLDEARGMGSFLSESTTVHNSHGTDVGFSHDETERMPLNKLADTVEQKIRPTPQSEVEKVLCELRSTAEAFRRASLEGRNLLQKNFPVTSFGSLLYVSHSTAVFSAWNASKKPLAVRMQCVTQGMKAETDEVYKRLTGLGFAEHLVPVLRKEWLPLDDSHIILVTWMPLMERRGSEDNDNHKRGLSEAEALCLGKNMAAALGALHRRGLVHHDVKPENLFVQPGDPLSDRTEVYLGDYSSVKPVERQYQGHMSVTRAFAAPEIMEQRPYSYSCDVYSWFRALLMMSRTTWPRFDEQTPAVFSVESGKGVIVHQGNRFWVIWPCGNDALLAVIEKAFQTDPELRFFDGAQLLQALEAISQEYP